MKTYIRDNSSVVRRVINLMVDTHPCNDVELRKEWKYQVLIPYINFLSDLEVIKKYGWIDNNSQLKPHCEFIDKIITICEGASSNTLPSEKFNHHLNQMIGEWLEWDLDSQLKVEEQKFYTRIAWQDEPLENEEKKDTPLQKKKMEAMTMLNKYKNNLG